MTSLDEGRVPPGGAELASIAQRAVALLIDQLLVAVPVVVGALVWGVDPRGDVTTDQLLAMNVALVGLGTVHEIVGVAVFGQTAGKHVLRIRVVRSADAGRVSWTYAAVRSLVTSAASLVPTVGVFVAAGVYLWAAFDPLRQGLHDKLAGTLVVRVAPRVSR